MVDIEDLLLACEEGDIEQVRAILDSGEVAVDEVNAIYHSPLKRALLLHNWKIAELLLFEYDADPYVYSYTVHDESEYCEDLLSEKNFTVKDLEDIYEENIERVHVFFTLCRNDELDLVKRLIEAGKFNGYGCNGHSYHEGESVAYLINVRLDIFELLLHSGFDLKDLGILSFFYEAMSEDRWDIAAEMLQKGIRLKQVFFENDEVKETGIYIIAKACKHKQWEVVNLLLEIKDDTFYSNLKSEIFRPKISFIINSLISAEQNDIVLKFFENYQNKIDELLDVMVLEFAKFQRTDLLTWAQEKGYNFADSPYRQDVAEIILMNLSQALGERGDGDFCASTEFLFFAQFAEKEDLNFDLNDGSNFIHKIAALQSAALLDLLWESQHPFFEQANGCCLPGLFTTHKQAVLRSDFIKYLLAKPLLNELFEQQQNEAICAQIMANIISNCELGTLLFLNENSALGFAKLLSANKISMLIAACSNVCDPQVLEWLKTEYDLSFAHGALEGKHVAEIFKACSDKLAAINTFLAQGINIAHLHLNGQNLVLYMINNNVKSDNRNDIFKFLLTLEGNEIDNDCENEDNFLTYVLKNEDLYNDAELLRTCLIKTQNLQHLGQGGKSAIHLAAELNRTDILQDLVHNGAIIDWQNNNFLKLIITKDKKEVFEFLVQNKLLSLDIITEQDIITRLFQSITSFYAIEQEMVSEQEIVTEQDVFVAIKCLIENHIIDLDFSFNRGKILLHKIINCADIDFLKWCLANYDGMLDSKDNRGETPLICAATSYSKSAMKFKMIFDKLGTLDVRTYEYILKSDFSRLPNFVKKVFLTKFFEKYLLHSELIRDPGDCFDSEEESSLSIIEPDEKYPFALRRIKNHDTEQKLLDVLENMLSPSKLASFASKIPKAVDIYSPFFGAICDVILGDTIITSANDRLGLLENVIVNAGRLPGFKTRINLVIFKALKRKIYDEEHNLFRTNEITITENGNKVIVNVPPEIRDEIAKFACSVPVELYKFIDVLKHHLIDPLKKYHDNQRGKYLNSAEIFKMIAEEYEFLKYIPDFMEVFFLEPDRIDEISFKRLVPSFDLSSMRFAIAEEISDLMGLDY